MIVCYYGLPRLYLQYSSHISLIGDEHFSFIIYHQEDGNLFYKLQPETAKIIIFSSDYFEKLANSHWCRKSIRKIQQQQLCSNLCLKSPGDNGLMPHNIC